MINKKGASTEVGAPFLLFAQSLITKHHT